MNKNDYLGEYTGELISHREADKRGKIYDRANSSFLFDLNDQASDLHCLVSLLVFKNLSCQAASSQVKGYMPFFTFCYESVLRC